MNKYLLFALAVTVAPFTASASDADDMSLSRARQLIASGEKLETIPRPVWKQLLSDEQFYILWEKGTERAFTGALLNNRQPGVYVTAGCEIPVFHSRHKFKSGTGWPSFWELYDSANIRFEDDWSWLGRRTEVLSACGEHLGHVFNDGPKPTGLRYCINSLALKFIPLAEFNRRQQRKKTSLGNQAARSSPFQ